MDSRYKWYTAHPSIPLPFYRCCPVALGVDLNKVERPWYERDFTVRTYAGYRGFMQGSPDHRNLRGHRHTQSYAEDVSDMIDRLRLHSSRPIFLIGGSQGSIAAVSAAVHLPGIAGIVLAEAVSIKGHSGETVFDASPGDVRVPVLIIANEKDGCWVAPPSYASHIADALQRSTSVQIFTVDGGRQRVARACGALSPHGYEGIETEVIGGIQRWLEQQEAGSAHSEV